jgi:hypothetical protein
MSRFAQRVTQQAIEARSKYDLMEYFDRGMLGKR